MVSSEECESNEMAAASSWAMAYGVMAEISAINVKEMAKVIAENGANESENS
jgi:hypothetical protein